MNELIETTLEKDHLLLLIELSSLIIGGIVFYEILTDHETKEESPGNLFHSWDLYLMAPVVS
jgi:hypothetical protein